MIAAAATFRPATSDDVDGILNLWRLGGVDHDEVHDRDEIVTKLGYDEDLFLIAELDGEIVASVMGTFDGHRGRVKRCVVNPSQQGTGVGRALVGALEQRFLERGITELRLEVWAENTGALAFWSTMGWQHLEDIRYFTRSLRDDASQ